MFLYMLELLKVIFYCMCVLCIICSIKYLAISNCKSISATRKQFQSTLERMRKNVDVAQWHKQKSQISILEKIGTFSKCPNVFKVLQH